MKFTIVAAAALYAVSTNAVAIASAEANPSPEAWCLWKGQSCWKAKRAAETFRSALQSTGGYKQTRAADVSNHPGGAAYHAKRSFEELAALVASAYPSPEALYEDLNLAGAFPPDSNLTIAEGEGEGEGDGPPPTPPPSSSSVAARDEAVAAIDPRWCAWKGQACWKRADDDASTTTVAIERRAAAPAFCPFGREPGSVCYASKRAFVEADRRACEEPGQTCHKARTAAEALLRAIESGEGGDDNNAATTTTTEKRDTTDGVEARWCVWKGQSCWKRDGMDDVVARCNSPSGACTAARRDLNSMHAAARNLLDTLDAEVV
jgi:hypothetical protein